MIVGRRCGVDGCGGRAVLPVLDVDGPEVWMCEWDVRMYLRGVALYAHLRVLLGREAAE